LVPSRRPNEAIVLPGPGVTTRVAEFLARTHPDSANEADPASLVAAG
jgi:hypothetical protein